MLRRLLTFFFYCLFVLGAIGVCLVLLFPRDKFLVWVSELIEKKLPGIEISAADIKYVHPFKIRLYELSVKDDQSQWEIPIDTLLVSFEPHYPIDHIGVIGVVFGGDLSFTLSLAKKGRLELVDLDLSEMHLRDLKMVQQGMGRPVAGIISMSGLASADRRTLKDIRFTGNLLVEQFHTPLREAVLEQTEVRFDKVSAEVVLNGTVVDVTDGSGSGPLIDGDFSGQIRVAEPLSSSLINFNGNLIPKPLLIEKNPALSEPLRLYFHRYDRESIPYRIEGTVSEPLFRFENFN